MIINHLTMQKNGILYIFQIKDFSIIKCSIYTVYRIISNISPVSYTNPVSNKSPGSEGFEKYKPRAYIRDHTVYSCSNFSSMAEHCMAVTIQALLGSIPSNCCFHVFLSSSMFENDYLWFDYHFDYFIHKYNNYIVNSTSNF